MRLILADARAAHSRYRCVRARHDACHQRHHRAPRRADGADRHAKASATCSISRTESRYDQYDLTIDKPKPLVPRALRFTVPERIDVHGAVRLPLDEAAVRALVRELARAECGKRRRRLHALLRQSRARTARRATS